MVARPRIQEHQRATVKSGHKGALLVGAASIVALGAVEVVRPQERLIWNRTESAPIGLYWRNDTLPSLNGWALVSSRSRAGKWIAAHGFLASDWPLIKRVRAASGAEICRIDDEIFINNRPVARAFSRTQSGVALPNWSGCRVLERDEFLLLNDHERSLDGRYFGATTASEIDGELFLLWEAPAWFR